MVLPYSSGVSRVPPYSNPICTIIKYGAITLYGRPFHGRSSLIQTGIGLLPVRSPLLRESLLMSFPVGTEMFHFPTFASNHYVFMV